MAFVLLFNTQAHADSPYLVQKSKNSGYCKSEKNQRVTGKWQNFAGCKPFKLNGKRTLFDGNVICLCAIGLPQGFG